MAGVEWISRCVYCGKDLPVGQVCGRCEEIMQEDAIFGQMRPGMYAAYLYNQLVSRLMREFKYEGGAWLHPFIGSLIWCAVADLSYDAVAFVPLHQRRLKQRGFNQAELLARHIARLSAKPCIDVLLRTRHTRIQAHLPHEERLGNVAGAFALREHAGVQNLHILLVDDIITTGATIDQCAMLLREAGATVSCAAFAVARKSLHFTTDRV